MLGISEIGPLSRGHGRGLSWTYILGFGAPVALMAIVLMQDTVTPEFLLRDAMETLEAHPATGSISALADFIWFSAGLVCLFAAIVATQKAERAFLAVAGLMALMLSLDDYFMLHENMIPSITGIRERAIKIFYMVSTLTYLWVFRKAILAFKWPVLATAMLCFAVSMVADTSAISHLFSFLPREVIFYVIEDGCKIIGICLWSAFHIGAAYHILAAEKRGLRHQG